MTDLPLRSAKLVPALLLALSSVGAHAESKADKKACADAYTNAQQLRNDKKLVSARQQLLVCAQDACPAALSGDCARWLNEVDASMPSVVVLAQDASGTAIVDAKATMDGKPLAAKLDGRAIPVDPGPHTFHVEAAQGAKDETLVVAEGEKNRKIVVTVGAATASATKPTDKRTDETGPKSGPPVVAYVLGGVGVVGLASFAAFGLMGNKQASDDRAAGGCKPNCTSDEVSSIKSKYLIADVSLGVGVISLGVATYLFLSSGNSRESASSSTARVRFDAAPAPGGGFVGAHGTF